MRYWFGTGRKGEVKRVFGKRGEEGAGYSPTLKHVLYKFGIIGVSRETRSQVSLQGKIQRA